MQEHHRQETVRIIQSARARTERARREAIDAPLQHLPELDRGREFLNEVTEKTLKPHVERQKERVTALHALWEKHVYVPIRDQLQHKRAGAPFSMLEEASGSAVHRAERGRRVLNAAESRASLEQVDPNHAHAFRVEREKSDLSATSNALVLARRHGAIVHANGSYELPAPRTVALASPLPHALLSDGNNKPTALRCVRVGLDSATSCAAVISPCSSGSRVQRRRHSDGPRDVLPDRGGVPAARARGARCRARHGLCRRTHRGKPRPLRGA